MNNNSGMINTVSPGESVSPFMDIFEEIKRLKHEKNAIILAHYYQEPDIQDVADIIGDSLALAQQAAATTADTIVFAGVHFMAETAKILNPSRKVLLPDPDAGCSLSDSCPPDRFRTFIDKHPGAVVVSYINCSAEIKAMSDIICTSGNAEKVIASIPHNKPIIFGPDKNLGKWLITKTKRPMILWDGACMVHEIFSRERIVKLKMEHPEAAVIAHPECEESVLEMADVIGSTAKLLEFTRNSEKMSFIVATESGIIHQMKKSSPAKIFIPAPPQNGCACNNCPHMKLNTLEKLHSCLKNGNPEIIIPEELRHRAEGSIRRMLEISAR